MLLVAAAAVVVRRERRRRVARVVDVRLAVDHAHRRDAVVQCPSRERRIAARAKDHAVARESRVVADFPAVVARRSTDEARSLKPTRRGRDLLLRGERAAGEALVLVERDLRRARRERRPRRRGAGKGDVHLDGLSSAEEVDEDHDDAITRRMWMKPPRVYELTSPAATTTGRSRRSRAWSSIHLTRMSFLTEVTPFTFLAYHDGGVDVRPASSRSRSAGRRP